MPPITRTASKPASKKAGEQKQPVQPASPWEESRLIIAVLAGLLGVLVCRNFLTEEQAATFSDFLKGQVGFSGVLTSVLFWKMAISFLVAGAGAYFLTTEIPAAQIRWLNRPARAVGIFVLAILIYIPAMSAGFLWDDDQEITANQSLMNPRDPSKPNWYGLWEIWTGGLTNVYRPTPGVPPPLPDTFWVKCMRKPLRAIEKTFDPDTKFIAHESADYFPLKTTMLWLEYTLWGHDQRTGAPIASAFHVMNIIIHAIDVLLLWLVLSQLRVPGAWLGALLFAVHPVHVESVAWIAERKNTLSLFFYLLSISAWLRFEDRFRKDSSIGDDLRAALENAPSSGRGGRGKAPQGVFGKLIDFVRAEGFLSGVYIGALLLCIGSLLCKTHVVVLPAVLLLTTWWRSGKLTVRDIVRAVPFFVISLLLAEVTIWFQNGRAIGQEVIPIGDAWSRIAGAGLATWWYIAKVLLPINLNTIYEFIGPFGATWPLKPQFWMYIMGIAALGLLYLLWAGRKSLGRTPFYVYAYFLGTLFPVLGLFKMSYMRLTLVADHFQYLSDISVVALIGALVVLGWRKADQAMRPLIAGAVVIVICTFSAYSWERAGVHQSEKTLWTACLEKNDNSWQAHNHLGAVIYMEGNVPAAQIHFQRAVDLKPENPEVHNNLGLAFAYAQRWDEALLQYRRAVQIKGDVPAMRRNLADCMSTLKKFDEAAVEYKIVLDADPNDPNCHLGYGYALSQLGRLSEAREQFEAALRIDPNNPRARQNLDAVKKMLSGK